MDLFLLGASCIASLVVALFFLRFWLDTRDRFFLLFAAAFAVDAAVRVTLATRAFEEHEPFLYLGRLLMFVLIIAAILDKNRAGRGRAAGGAAGRG